MMLSLTAVFCLLINYTSTSSIDSIECKFSSNNHNVTDIFVSDLLKDINELTHNVAVNISLIQFFSEGGEHTSYSPFILRKRATLYSASFAWLFKDLNNIIFRYNNPDTKYKKLINEHCAEDGSHWRMFIYDWRILGLDDSGTRISEAHEFFFSDFTQKSREAVYKLIRLDTQVDGMHNELNRFIIIETFEFIARHLFDMIGKDYDNYLNHTNGLKIQYFGKLHSQLEKGKLSVRDTTNTAETIFGKIKIENIDKYNYLLNIAKEVLDSITPHWDSKYKFLTDGWRNQILFTNIF